MQTYIAHEPTPPDSESWWVRVLDVPGWQDHVIDVLPALVDGQPRVIGLRITPCPDHKEPPDSEPLRKAQAITSSSIRTLAVSAFAADAYAAMKAKQGRASPRVLQVSGTVTVTSAVRGNVDKVARIADIRRRSDERRQQQSHTKRRRGRPPKCDLQEFAEVYMVGLDAGVNPRREVAEVLSLAPRTIDRYLAAARRAGLIPGAKEKGATP